MGGIPCWCETRDGDRFGAYPGEESGLQIFREELVAGSGGSLGLIAASVRSPLPPTSLQVEALHKGAGLAALAIETRRLHADLVRRAEFDSLTDAYTRYFIEKELDTLIHTAEENGGALGVIYFDLDDFKSVNDSYGHAVGDAYLKQVAARIKSQLRGQDKLARFGGDEFTVLVPRVRDRAELEEIVARLEACLDQPMRLEGHELRSSASFGLAIYPEDGRSREELLQFADTAMYAVKLRKRT
jgi:diguanylate cyclase (GGDEF)-like protein